jgi:hypothetical protein
MFWIVYKVHFCKLNDNLLSNSKTRAPPDSPGISHGGSTTSGPGEVNKYMMQSSPSVSSQGSSSPPMSPPPPPPTSQKHQQPSGGVVASFPEKITETGTGQWIIS